MQHPTDDRGWPLSPDRQWVWDGERWERAGQTLPRPPQPGNAKVGRKVGSRLQQTAQAWKGWSAPTRFAVIFSSIIAVLMFATVVLVSAQRSTSASPSPIAEGVTPTIPFTPGESFTPTPQIIATPTTVVTPTSTSAPPPSPTQAPSAPPTVAVLGFGATDAEWNSRHRQTPGFTAGAVYDADPSLPQVNGHVGSRYIAVSHEQGRVLGYSMAFHPGTGIKEARRQ
jgi:hypothetical protein